MEDQVYDNIPKIYNVSHNNPFKIKLTYIDVKRYLVDATYLQEFEYNVHGNNAYDIILTDNNFKMKCAVIPSHNQIFEFNILKPNTLIEGHVRWSTSKTNSNKKYLLLHGYKVLSEPPPEEPKKNELINNIPEIRPLQYFDFYNLNEDIPLIGNRSCYVHMHSDIIPLGQQWNNNNKKDFSKFISTPHKLFSNPNQHYYSIDDICKDYREKNTSDETKKRKSNVLDDPFLIARIKSKSILNNFAKSSDQIPYPFSFSVRLGDISGEINLTLWNNLCQKYYNSLNVGDLIVVRDFVVKESFFNKNVESKDWYCDFYEGDLELSLNPGCRDITIITGPILELEEFKNICPLTQQFVKGNEIMKCLEDSPNEISKAINYTGKVMFVGNEEKIFIRNKYYLSKWIAFYDSTLDFDVVFLCISNINTPQIRFNDILKVSNVIPYHVKYGESETSSTLFLYPTFSTQVNVDKSELYSVRSKMNLFVPLRSIPFKSYYQKIGQKEFFNRIDKVESFEDIETSLKKQPLLQRREVFIQGFINNIYFTIGKDNSPETLDSRKMLNTVINLSLTDIDRNKQMCVALPVVPQLFSFRELHLLKIENLKMRLLQYLNGQCTDDSEQIDAFRESLKKNVSNKVYTMNITIYRIDEKEYDFVVNNLYVNREENNNNDILDAI